MKATKTKEKEKWTGKRIAKLVVDIVCWIFFAFAAVFTVFAFLAQSSVTNFPTIGGKALLTVQSDSMESDHGFNVGDLIIVKVLPNADSTKAKDIEKRNSGLAEIKALTYNAEDPTKVDDYGSVITFWKDLNADGTLELNSHRVIKIETRADGHIEYTTKGDNVAYNDPYKVLDNDVVGVWTGGRARGMGAFISFLQPGEGPEHLGFIFCIILPLAGFLAYEIVVLVLTIRKANGKDKRVISKAEEELIKQKAIEEFIKKQEAEKEASKETTDEK